MNVYIICMIIGLVIPLFSLVADFLDGCVDLISVDLDFLNIDIGDVQLSLLPLSINSICSGLLVFGGVGYLMQNGSLKSLLWINVIAIASGYLMAVTVQTMIQKLKNIEHPAYKEKELLLNDAKVINRIPADGLGAVSIELPGSSSVSYPARSFDNQVIAQDTLVEVVEIVDGIVVARSKDWLLHKYDAAEASVTEASVVEANAAEASVTEANAAEVSVTEASATETSAAENDAAKTETETETRQQS